MHNLEYEIANYKPSDQTVALVRATRIALLVGISGAGKDTIKRELLKESEFHDIVSHTTRTPRVNNGVAEVPDVDYHFIDMSQAEKMLEAQEFIEAKLVHGTIYATSAMELQKSHDEDKIAITDLDVQGVAEYKKLSQKVIAMFILPPNYAMWRERLSQRYESEEAFAAEWEKRRSSAVSELAHALEVPYYHFIVNNELSHTIKVAREIAGHSSDTFNRKDEEARASARNLLEEIKQSL